MKTGLVKFDEMMGGQFPEGSIGELYGIENCGKTTFAIELTKAFKKPYYLEYENKFDTEYAEKIGFNCAKFNQPVTFENGIMDFYDKWKKEQWDVLIIDTLASAVTQSDLDTPMDDKFISNKAHKISRLCVSWEKTFKRLGVSLIMINHRRKKFNAPKYGEQFYTPGGDQKNYTCDYRISVSKRKSKIWDDGIIMKLMHKKIQKFQGECEYTVRWGKGICRNLELYELGVECGVVKVKGRGGVSFNGEISTKIELIDKLETDEKLQKMILDAYNKGDK